MSKERARRRAVRLAEEEKARAKQARRVARRQRRRALLRRLTPRRIRGRTGRMFARRGRGERAAIVTLSLVAALMIWLLVDALALRLALTTLFVIALPAFITIAFGRRT